MAGFEGVGTLAMVIVAGLPQAGVTATGLTEGT
jgi:hypothetical protein